MSRVIEIVLDEVGYRKLVRKFEGAGGILAGFAQIAVREGFDIGEIVPLFVILEIGLYAAEFLLYYDKPVVDEFGRDPGGLVAVEYPTLVIGVYKGVEYVLGSLRETVLYAEHDHGSLLAGYGYVHSGGVALGNSLRIAPADKNLIVPEGYVLGRYEYNTAHRRFKGVEKRTVDHGPLQFLGLLSPDCKAAEGEVCVGKLFKPEGERRCGILSQKHHLDRGVVAEFHRPEGLLLVIGGEETETGRHDFHKVGRREGLHFVVHIGREAQSGHGAREGREVPHRRFLGTLIYDDLGRTAVYGRRTVHIEGSRNHTQYYTGDVPPLVVPEKMPQIQYVDGGFFLLAYVVSKIFFHFTTNWLIRVLQTDL